MFLSRVLSKMHRSCSISLRFPESATRLPDFGVSNHFYCTQIFARCFPCDEPTRGSTRPVLLTRANYSNIMRYKLDGSAGMMRCGPCRCRRTPRDFNLTMCRAVSLNSRPRNARASLARIRALGRSGLELPRQLRCHVVN